MSDTLIKVENASKKFCRSLKKSLWYGMQDLGNELLGRRHGGDGELRPKEFWAVKDVSFELKRGECLGLIGRNGAGKTTLLRMLNGLIKPDAGRIEMRGRVGALIALGAGFNPILTGRENIYVNASILGFSKKEVDKKFDNIIEFAELSEFIDSPVQHYSSGMFMRLGFSVAANFDPDILLVDEALAVGDLAFTIKCINRIAELRQSGTSVIFVSHNELQIREAASRCLVLAQGKIIGNSSIDEAFALYRRSYYVADLVNLHDAGYVHEGPVRMKGCSVVHPNRQGTVATGDNVRLDIRCISQEDVKAATLKLRFWDAFGQISTSIDSLKQNMPLTLLAGENLIEVDIYMLALLPGHYRLAGGVIHDGTILGWAYELACLEVVAPSRFKTSEGYFYTLGRVQVKQPTLDESTNDTMY